MLISGPKGETNLKSLFEAISSLEISMDSYPVVLVIGVLAWTVRGVALSLPQACVPALSKRRKIFGGMGERIPHNPLIRRNAILLKRGMA